MLPADKVPIFDEKGASSQGCEHQGRLCVRIAKMAPSSCAAALVLRMNSVAREVCLSAGGNRPIRYDGAMCMLEILRNYFAPEVAGLTYQDLVRFTYFRRTGQSIGEYIAEYDSLRRKAESKVDMGAGFSEQ